jgi:hypothetical protein
MRRDINSIISEEIERSLLLNEDNSLKTLFSDLMKFINKDKKKSGGKKKNKKKKDKDKKKKKSDDEPQIRKKKVVGGTQNYDYTDYLSKNRKLAKSDFEKVSHSIDQDLTDIAAVARKVYPDHTDEGGQSQLRKVLNGERPMTRPVAKKLKTMISRGQIAVK